MSLDVDDDRRPLSRPVELAQLRLNGVRRREAPPRSGAPVPAPARRTASRRNPSPEAVRAPHPRRRTVPVAVAVTDAVDVVVVAVDQRLPLTTVFGRRCESRDPRHDGRKSFRLRRRRRGGAMVADVVKTLRLAASVGLVDT